MIQNFLKQVRGSLSRLSRARLPKISLPASTARTDEKVTGNHENNLEIEEKKPASDSRRKLLVFNSFTKAKQPATANGEQIFVTNTASNRRLLARAYICGPTVYDDSHIGHAMTYLRFDLIRRTLAKYCSVDLGR